MDHVADSAKARPSSWLDCLARRPALVLLIVALVAWLPGFLMLPPLDRDESRFAEASREMIQSGDFVDIHLAGGHRYNKPIGIYWLQSAAAAICGPAWRDRIWVYRLPSLATGFLSLLLLYGVARAIVPPGTALLAGLL